MGCTVCPTVNPAFDHLRIVDLWDHTRLANRAPYCAPASMSAYVRLSHAMVELLR